MAGAESHIIVDFEQSFLRNPYPFSTYLPFFYQIAQEEEMKSSIAKKFSEQYRDKILTLKTVYHFLKEYEDDLYMELLLNTQSKLSAEEEKYLHPCTLLEIDETLKKKIIELYESLSQPIIIVTANPYSQLIADYLNYTLPKGSFTIVYAPLLNTKEETVSNIELFTITPGTESPPPGYSLLINSKGPNSKSDWPNYAAKLKQRLLNTGYFCDFQKEKELREQKLREQQLKEKERNEAVPAYIQEEWMIYSKGRSSPGFFIPSDNNSASVSLPTVQRVKREDSYSPSRSDSPAFMASPTRSASPAQHIPLNMGAFKRSR